MDTAIDINACWQRGKARDGAREVSASDLRSISASHAKKQFRTVAGFVWASLAHQIILYSFLACTLVRNWGNTNIMVLCLAGAAVYVPMTAMLLRRARALFNGATADISNYVRGARDRLADFYRFKRRMDVIGVPVSSAIVVFVTFTLFVPGGLAAYPIAGAVVFAAWIGMSAVAVCAENRKRFVAPLRHLDAVIEDVERAESAVG